MNRNLAFFLLIVLLCGCDKQQRRINEITKIEIATGGCFGPCQSTVVSVDSSLNYRYWGGGDSWAARVDDSKNGKLRGYFSAKTSREFWDTLNIKLEQINFKQLDTVYAHSVDDQSLSVLIHYGNKIKHINAHSASLPDSVGRVFYYIIRSYKTIKPKPTKDTFLFEPANSPYPKPDPRDVRFPPPIKNN
jgi:hypothetical protein